MSTAASRKEEIMKNVRELSEILQYPINDLDNLVGKVGEDFVVSKGYNDTKLKDINNEIPNDFFPIKDKQQLLNKAEKIYDRLREESIKQNVKLYRDKYGKL